jgi:hypothetical protein
MMNSIIRRIVKIRVFFVSTLLILTGAQATTKASGSGTYSIPELVSFTFTPSEIDLIGPSTLVSFELMVKHPIGIESTRVKVDLTSAKGNTLSVDLNRVDSPIDFNLKTVTFKGSLEIPRNIKNENYAVVSEAVVGIAPVGATTSPYSPKFTVSNKLNNIVGAEYDLIIRSGGNLDFDYATFIGPSHATSFTSQREYPKLTQYKSPIWKVGEFYSPSDYYELRVPGLELAINSKDSKVCTSDGKNLKFIAEGDCYFTVSTPKTKNYNYREDYQLATISKARIQQELTVENFPNQKALNLPYQLKIPRVYSLSQGYIIPKTLTPQICLVSEGYVNIFSGGVCRYTYQALETGEFLESKIYELSFEVLRDAQTISFTPPATANLSAKTLALSATASGGGVITYQTTSTGICSITGSTLNLLKGGNCAITATQAGSATLAPISAMATVMIAGSVAPTKKTITCVKGKKTKKVSGTNPKCPKGYKVKR